MLDVVGFCIMLTCLGVAALKVNQPKKTGQDDEKSEKNRVNEVAVAPPKAEIEAEVGVASRLSQTSTQPEIKLEVTPETKQSTVIQKDPVTGTAVKRVTVTKKVKSTKKKRSKQPVQRKVKQSSKPKKVARTHVQGRQRKKGELKDLYQYEMDSNCFLTRSNFTKCVAHDHNLYDIAGIVSIDIGKKYQKVRFPAVYCQTCDKFFVLERVYQRLKKRGRLLCKVVTTDFWLPKYLKVENSNDDSIYGNPESHLHMLGYNVNAQLNLSKVQRRSILRQIIINGDLTRGEICNHLIYLINRNQNNSKFDVAITKWLDDLKYVENLDFNYSRIPVDELRINQYH